MDHRLDIKPLTFSKRSSVRVRSVNTDVTSHIHTTQPVGRLGPSGAVAIAGPDARKPSRHKKLNQQACSCAAFQSLQDRVQASEGN